MQANGTAEIRATVLEASGTPVQNGTTVTFTTNLGALSPTEARTTNGVAIGAVRGQWAVGHGADQGAFRRCGLDRARVGSGCGGCEPSDPDGKSNQISAGGVSTLTARVIDAGGNPLSGVVVTFSTDAGSLSSTVATTSASGEAQVTLTATRDATVTATAGAGTAVTVTTKVTVARFPTSLLLRLQQRLSRDSP